MKPANVVMPILLFVLFFPGFLFTIPGAIWTPGQADWAVLFTHTAIFAFLWVFLRGTFARYY